MAKFDRSQWKPTPISAVQEEENRSKETARFFGSNNYTTYYTIEDGENEFRILPNHEPGKSAYVATRTALLECEGDKYENGQIVGKEVRNRKVFIATTHSAGKMKEDPIETYIEFAQELAKSQFDDPKQQEKFLNPIRGYRQGTKWVPGILPNSEFVAYVVGKQGIGRVNLRNKWLKDMQDLSIQQTAGDVIAIDIFSHPTQGFPLVIHKGLSAQNRTEYKVYTRPLKVGEGWDDFFKKYAITDEQWNTWENLPHLNDLFVGSYSQKDFNMALDGLKRFDEKHGYNTHIQKLRRSIMFQIEKTTLIAEIMENAPYVAPMFQAIGMHCMGCAMASGENVEEACAAHGVDVDKFVEKVNEFIAAQG